MNKARRGLIANKTWGGGGCSDEVKAVLDMIYGREHQVDHPTSLAVVAKSLNHSLFFTHHSYLTLTTSYAF